MVALIAARVAAVPGWEAQRWLARACASTAAFAALGLPLLVPEGGALGGIAPLAPAAIRLQLLVVAVTLHLWMEYADAYLASARSRVEVAAVAVALAAGALALVPGLVVGSTYHEHRVLGFAVRDAALGPLADAVAATIVGAYGVLALRFARAWRRGVPAAGAHAAAFGALVVLAAHDALAWRFAPLMPNLADLGAALPTAAIGLTMAFRLVREARAAADLRQHLEARVDAGTRALARSREALHRAEQLAAVGELAAGVAHEVNNPAASARGNIAWLVEHLEHGLLPEDAPGALRDALRSLDRIADIVRRLTGAGRLATSGAQAHPVEVGGIVRESLRLARARCPDHVRLEQPSGADVAASTDEGLLVQVLVNLVVNGAQAVPPGRAGRVVVTAADHGDRVVIAVEDDGEGMAPDVLARVFEPFFTTKPVGVGTGLGLSISRGLLAAVGGTLRLESVRGAGTRAIVELPAAARRSAGAPERLGGSAAA
jgi:signal transduction histidine kinase